MKLVLTGRRTSTYQHGISTYEKMFNHHVLPCTSISCLVLTCTALYCQKYVLVRTCTYVLVICLYQYVPLCTAMRKFPKVCTSMYYRRVHTGTYRYRDVHVCTATNLVYRIPDGHMTRTKWLGKLIPDIYQTNYMATVCHIPGIYRNMYEMSHTCPGQWPWPCQARLGRHGHGCRPAAAAARLRRAEPESLAGFAPTLRTVCVQYLETMIVRLTKLSLHQQTGIYLGWHS